MLVVAVAATSADVAASAYSQIRLNTRAPLLCFACSLSLSLSLALFFSLSFSTYFLFPLHHFYKGTSHGRESSVWISSCKYTSFSGTASHLPNEQQQNNPQSGSSTNSPRLLPIRKVCHSFLFSFPCPLVKVVL